MKNDHICGSASMPGWMTAVVVFASGLIIGRTIAQLVGGSGWF
jgi:hypothetical protein